MNLKNLVKYYKNLHYLKDIPLKSDDVVETTPVDYWNTLHPEFPLLMSAAKMALKVLEKNIKEGYFTNVNGKSVRQFLKLY